MNKQNIILTPWWTKSLKLSNKNKNFNIYRGDISSKNDIDNLVGYSMGALIALQNKNKLTISKIILVNPPLPRRNIFIWFFHWLNYILNEGLSFNVQNFDFNPIRLAPEIIKCISLLSADYSEILKNIPKNNLIVLRGKRDHFFCDHKAVEFLKSKNVKVIEIENAGHNWCKEIEDAVCKLIS